jgi:hypothetical protein
MTEFELLAVSHQIVSRMDVAMEFWISGTFAVLVTFFFVENRATTKLKWLSACLYLIFSSLMVFRYLQLGAIYTTVRTDLEQLGSSYAFSTAGNVISATLTIFLLIVGTLTAAYFIFSKDKIVQSDSGEDTK